MITKYNQYIKESVSVSKQEANAYVIYTADLDQNNIKKLYQILFDNGFQYYRTSSIELLSSNDLDINLMIINLLSKQILNSDANVENNVYSINQFLESCCYHKNIYLVKDIGELKSIFSKVNINTYTNQKELVYESLKDKLEGPSIGEVVKNLENFQPNDAMIYSLENDLIDEFENALERGADIKKTFFVGYKGYSYNVNALTCCAVLDNEELFDYILETYDKYFDLEKEIKTLLLDYKLKYVEKLLDYGVNFSVINIAFLRNDYNRRNPKIQELIKKYGSVKESLLDKLEGPSENDVFNAIKNYSPDRLLEYSCENDILRGVKYAIKKGANINKSFDNYFGNTPLCIAVNNENYDMVKYLISKGADVNVDENYPLYSAIELQNYKITKLLFETGIRYHNLTKSNIKQLYNRKDGNYYSDDIKKLIEKYILNTNESLLDKLEGPSKEDVEEHYKGLYLSGKLNLFDYYRYCFNNNIKGPNKKDVSDFLEGSYNNKKIKLEEYYTLSRDYNLDGPSKSYLWKSFGFDKEYKSEEYFNYLTEGIEIISPNGLYYEWKKDNKTIFEQYLSPEKLIFMNYSNIFRIYELLFDMDFRTFSKFMKKMFNKYFGDKINIYEYEFRINY